MNIQAQAAPPTIRDSIVRPDGTPVIRDSAQASDPDDGGQLTTAQAGDPDDGGQFL